MVIRKQPPNSIESVLLNVNEEVIMKIIIIKIKNRITGDEVSLTAFLDTDAKRTYILTEKAKILNLRVTSCLC